MALLPQFQSDDRVFNQMQQQWASQLNTLLKNPSLQSSILQSIQLSSGDNTINHKLGKKLTGWRIIRQRGVASNFYDKQDDNPRPELTLILNSSAAVSVDLEVF